MTSRSTHRRRTHHLIAVLAAATLAFGACSSDDAGDDAGNGSADGSTTEATITTTPSSQWGDLAECAIGPQTDGSGGVSSGDDVDGEIDGVVDYGDQAQDHVEGCVDYPVRPAVGGPHHMPWGNCGFYSSPVPDEIVVHILEHGGVSIAFAPDLAAEQLDTIRSVVAKASHLVASPYPGLTSPVVLSAWGKQLSLDSVDDARFQQFIDYYVQGPQTPEPGAPCEGGIGDPEDR